VIEHLEIDDYKMGIGGEILQGGEYETYHAIREQLYAMLMGWA
jgi:hypothetical protein